MTLSYVHPTRPAPGSTVSLVAPAGPVSPEGVERALGRVAEMGWVPRLGQHVGGTLGYLSAPDGDRADDLNAALHDPESAAIWCLRGGYGTMRILDRVEWRALQHRPRPLIGFSDNTALHLAAFRRGLVTFHGPHPAAHDLSAFSLRSLRRALDPAPPAGPLPLPDGSPAATAAHGGRAEGRLVGGNLALITATLGTPVELRPHGGILFLEEVGEPVYRIDRMLTQLLLAGTLDEVAGIAIGAFSECPDAGRGGIPTAEEVLAERLGRLGIPILLRLPFGHVSDSWTLPVGVRARLDADVGTLELLEPATVHSGHAPPRGTPRSEAAL